VDLDYLEIDNVVALRGDSIKSETYFTPNKDGHNYANELVQQIVDLNQGNYLDKELLNSYATHFCIGVSGYPEKHMEAPSLESDLYFLKKKVKAGADYIITQMFFDNQKFFDFVTKAREEGITVPIIPGLKPLSTTKQLNMIPHRFHVDLPEALIKEVIKCKDNNAVRQVGVEWCIQQSKELMTADVPFLHYYSMGKSDNIKQIAEGVF
jgi:methylenetetrahydrofolate reductase (NADPH)